jgi:uncharacterized membrane protein YgdD (TMEM256/DUF423 family)
VSRTWIVVGAVLAFLGVAAGAFGAHALEGRVSGDLVRVFETGARYHLVHALALTYVGLASARWTDPLWTAAGWLFVVGVVVFSGSLYALALTGDRWLGAITPLGGVAFLAGWLAVAAAAWRSV